MAGQNRSLVEYEEIATDVLVIGGGLAGCFAAIKAREAGARVVLFDKAAIRRSGNAGHGMDHLPAIAYPGLTMDPDQLGQRAFEGMEGLVDPKLTFVIAEEGLHRALDLHDYGVHIFHKGNNFLYVPSRYELGQGKEKKWSQIFISGGDMKIRLAARVRKLGVKVVERTVGSSLLTKDGHVVGATGVNIRTGQFIVCKAKAVVISTGSAHRLYWQPDGLMTNYYCPTNCGDGHAIAYRAGARLTGMEFVQAQTHTKDYPAGPRPHGFFAVMVNDKGENIQHKWEPLGNMLAAHNMAAFEEYDAGRVPYWSTDQISAQARDMWAIGMANEHPISLKFSRPYGGTQTKEPREARTRIYGIYRSMSGPIVDEHLQTSLRGLFGGGDTINSSGLGGCTNAFVTGARAGHFAAEYAASAGAPTVDVEQVKSEQARVFAYYGREKGIKPVELEETVRLVVNDYVGIRKSGPKLERGLEVLDQVMDYFKPQLSVSNPHELMRYLELENIALVAKVLFKASLFREETRWIPAHWRLDFPQQDDDKWKKAVIVQKVDDRMILAAESPDRWMRRD